MNVSTNYYNMSGGDNSDDLLTSIGGGDHSSIFTPKKVHLMQLD